LATIGSGEIRYRCCGGESRDGHVRHICGEQAARSCLLRDRLAYRWSLPTSFRFARPDPPHDDRFSLGSELALGLEAFGDPTGCLWALRRYQLDPGFGIASVAPFAAGLDSARATSPHGATICIPRHMDSHNLFLFRDRRPPRTSLSLSSHGRGRRSARIR
jgi:hypothetical protein